MKRCGKKGEKRRKGYEYEEEEEWETEEDSFFRGSTFMLKPVIPREILTLPSGRRLALSAIVVWDAGHYTSYFRCGSCDDRGCPIWRYYDDTGVDTSSAAWRSQPKGNRNKRIIPVGTFQDLLEIDGVGMPNPTRCGTEYYYVPFSGDDSNIANLTLDSDIIAKAQRRYFGTPPPEDPVTPPPEDPVTPPPEDPVTPPPEDPVTPPPEDPVTPPPEDPVTPPPEDPVTPPPEDPVIAPGKPARKSRRTKKVASSKQESQTSYTKSMEASRELVLTASESDESTISLTRAGSRSKINLAVVGTLGKPGKEGTTYRVRIKESGGPPEEYAMKVFRKNKKSLKVISKEAAAQSYAAAAGLAPRVYGVLLENGPPQPSGGKIIMQLMEASLRRLWCNRREC